MHGFRFEGSERFRLIRKLGEGGMGVVYEAFDGERGHAVALKTLKARSALSLARFKREFRTLADLSHPNLCQLHDLFVDSEQTYFTMELLHGVSFVSWSRRAAESESLDPLELRETFPVSDFLRRFDEGHLRTSLAQLVKGLHALHGEGKLHRDVKPSNVVVTAEGRVVVVDFGLACELSTDGDDTPAEVVGTPVYMAPEQIDAPNSVTPAADWYAVGTMLYEILTGEPPFRGPLLQLVQAKVGQDAPSLGDLARHLPADLCSLAMDLLHRDPARRPSGDEILRRVGADVPARWSLRTPVPERAPFVGREEELESLRQAFLTSRPGAARVVFVEGESGLGKSALVRRFADDLVADSPDVMLLSGRCHQAESVPYKALDGVVDELASRLSRLEELKVAQLLPLNAYLLVKAFPVLGRVPAFATAPRYAASVHEASELRARVFRAFRETIIKLGERCELVLVIDDLQWADADSLDLLRATLRQADGPRLMLLATIRRGTGASVHALTRRLDVPVEVRTLEAMSFEEGRDLAKRLLRRAGVSNGDATQIAREARGHPLFISELARHAASVGAPQADPAQLDDALNARIDALEPLSRELLHLVAVAAAPLRREVFASALGVDPQALGGALRALRVGNLLRGGEGQRVDRVDVYHDRIRDAVVARLDADQARGWHLRLANALEEGGRHEVEVMAFHWEQAGHRDRAARYTKLAARQALEVLAFDRAARWFENTIALVPDDSSHELKQCLAEALSYAGRSREAAQAYLDASALTQGPTALGCQRRAAEELLRGGYIDEGIEIIGSVLTSAGLRLPETRRETVRAYLVEALRLRLRGRRFRMRSEGQIPRDELARIDVCWAMMTGLGWVDPLRSAIFVTLGLRLALQAGEPTRVVRFRIYRAALRAVTGRRGRQIARKELAAAHELGARAGDAWSRAVRPVIAGFIGFHAGQWSEARSQLEAGVAGILNEPTPDIWIADSGRVSAMWCHYYLGEFARLAEEVPALLDRAEQRGDLYAATNLRIGLSGTCWLIRDQPDEAIRQGELAREQWSPRDYQLQHCWQFFSEVRTRLYTGNIADAHERFGEHWERMKRAFLLRIETFAVEALHLRARVALCLAAQQGADRPLVQFAQENARQMERKGAAWGTALAKLVRAGVAACLGESERAIRELRQAVVELDAVEMAGYAAAARYRLARLLEGDEGAAYARASELFFQQQGVVAPAAMVQFLAPGFPEG